VREEERDRYDAEQHCDKLDESLADENNEVTLTPAHLTSTPGPIRHLRRPATVTVGFDGLDKGANGIKLQGQPRVGPARDEAHSAWNLRACLGPT